MNAQVSTANQDLSVNGTGIEEFRSNLRGPLLLPGEDGYDQARAVWNGMIDKRPALIARCVSAADVIQCVNFARTQGMVVSVRGGGHSFAGRAVCDGGLMIDLSLMKGAATQVDPAATAFPQRNPQWHYDIVAQWTDPTDQEENIVWARALWQETEPYTRGAGVNFLGDDDGDARVRVAYGQNYARLVDLKKKYDPTNFFSVNVNVVPS